MEPAVLRIRLYCNYLANLRLVEFLQSQPADVLAATQPGGYDSIGETVVHLVAVQERYARRFSPEALLPPSWESDGWPGFPRLRDSLRSSGFLLLRAATSAVEDASQLTEAMKHASEQRVNITTVLAARGIDHPAVAGWY